MEREEEFKARNKNGSRCIDNKGGNGNNDRDRDRGKDKATSKKEKPTNKELVRERVDVKDFIPFVIPYA